MEFEFSFEADSKGDALTKLESSEGPAAAKAFIAKALDMLDQGEVEHFQKDNKFVHKMVDDKKLTISCSGTLGPEGASLTVSVS